MIWVFIAIGILIAYLIGSIPNGFIIGKLVCNIDIREHGSGNIGTTNMLRILGWKCGITVMVLDILKGVIACLSMMIILNHFAQMQVWQYQFSLALAMVAAVIGHMFTPFLKFKGGKGIATAFGSLIMLFPICALFAVGIFIMVVLISKFVSLGSLLGTLAYAITATIIYNDSVIFIVFAWLIFVLILVAHRKNIIRLSKGEERKFSVGSKDKIVDEDTH